MKDQTNFNLNYYAISGNQIRFRRSFMLCVECTLSELRLYGIGKNIQKDQTLDGVIQSLV